MIDDATAEDTLLVLEQDDSLIDWDRRTLYTLTRQAGLSRMRYEHRRTSAEPLLAIPDAIAWCWAKGGDWRRRIEPAVTTIHRVRTGPGQREARLTNRPDGCRAHFLAATAAGKDNGTAGLTPIAANSVDARLVGFHVIISIMLGFAVSTTATPSAR